MSTKTLPQEGFGTPIDRATAQAYIDNFKRLKDALSVNVLPKLTGQDLPVPNHLSAKPGEVKNLFGSDYNGFMFGKEAVNRFFELGADFLLVLLGAKQDTGFPTIVLVGCNQDSDGVTFHSLKIDNVATEQPPKLVVPIVPLAPDKSLSFTIQ